MVIEDMLEPRSEAGKRDSARRREEAKKKKQQADDAVTRISALRAENLRKQEQARGRIKELEIEFGFGFTDWDAFYAEPVTPQ